MALRGLRRGEVCGLRWQDVDLVSATVTIREQVIVLDGVEHVGPPKSAAGVRVLALDPHTVHLLNQLRNSQRARFGRIEPQGRVFVHENGRPVRPDWLTRRFPQLAAGLDLPPVRLHDLRHGAASIASAAGVDLKVIQHDMGHSTALTTIDTYISVFAQAAQTAVLKTAQLLRSHARIRMSLEAASQA